MALWRQIQAAWPRARAYLSASAAASAAVRAYLSASAAAGSGMGKGGRVGRPLKLLLLAGCAVVAGIPAFLLGGGAQSLEAYRLGRMSPDDRARAQQAAHLQDPGLAVIGGEKAQVDAEIAKLLAEAASISDEAAKLEDEVAAALPALSDSARSDLGMDQGDVALVTSRIQHLHAQLPEIQRQLDVDFGAAPEAVVAERVVNKASVRVAMAKQSAETLSGDIQHYKSLLQESSHG